MEAEGGKEHGEQSKRGWGLCGSNRSNSSQIRTTRNGANRVQRARSQQQAQVASKGTGARHAVYAKGDAKSCCSDFYCNSRNCYFTLTSPNRSSPHLPLPPLPLSFSISLWKLTWEMSWGQYQMCLLFMASVVYLRSDANWHLSMRAAWANECVSEYDSADDSRMNRHTNTSTHSYVALCVWMCV